MVTCSKNMIWMPVGYLLFIAHDRFSLSVKGEEKTNLGRGRRWASAQVFLNGSSSDAAPLQWETSSKKGWPCVSVRYYQLTVGKMLD